MDQDVDARLTRLESALAYQSNTIDELSAVITQQWQMIEALQRKLDALATRFVVLEEQGDVPSENTRPPHW